MLTNYYQVLEVKQNADADTIRRAYLHKVRSVHPDINPTASAHKDFILLKEAYDTLSDENKRAAYDLKLKQSATAQQNVKNFHYDFKSNLRAMKKSEQTPVNTTILTAGIIAFLLALAGAVAVLLFKM